jgi:hypothetical protein
MAVRQRFATEFFLAPFVLLPSCHQSSLSVARLNAAVLAAQLLNG